MAMCAQIRPLVLRRVVLAGVKLGDKGAAELAAALRVNSTLRVCVRCLFCFVVL